MRLSRDTQPPPEIKTQTRTAGKLPGEAKARPPRQRAARGKINAVASFHSNYKVSSYRDREFCSRLDPKCCLANPVFKGASSPGRVAHKLRAQRSGRILVSKVSFSVNQSLVRLRPHDYFRGPARAPPHLGSKRMPSHARPL